MTYHDRADITYAHAAKDVAPILRRLTHCTTITLDLQGSDPSLPIDGARAAAENIRDCYDTITSLVVDAFHLLNYAPVMFCRCIAGYRGLQELVIFGNVNAASSDNLAEDDPVFARIEELLHLLPKQSLTLQTVVIDGRTFRIPSIEGPGL